MSTLLLVHAHPDDEAISTGGAMLRAHRDGHRQVLVTCTRGELGEIHNMDEAAVRPRLAEVRTEELRRACAILGVDRQVFLDYRDSGMEGTDGNDDLRSFHRAELGEAADRLAAIILEERPEVVVTYAADGIYGHPDHVKAHHVTMAALDLARERDGWEPAKAYWVVLSAADLARMAELPGGDEVEQSMVSMASRLRGWPEEAITTVLDVGEFAGRKRDAFREHVSQNDPESWIVSFQDSILEAMLGTEKYVLARGMLAGGGRESDLFEGLPRG